MAAFLYTRLGEAFYTQVLYIQEPCSLVEGHLLVLVLYSILMVVHPYNLVVVVPFCTLEVLLLGTLEVVVL